VDGVGGGLEYDCVCEADGAGDACCQEKGLVGYGERRGRPEDGADGEGGLFADPDEVAEAHRCGRSVVTVFRSIGSRSSRV